MCIRDRDDTGPRTKLRYVFDIADTHLVRGGKTPLLWNLDSHEHEQTILDHLADTYGLSPVSYTHLDVYKRQPLPGSWSRCLISGKPTRP